jgi:uncharacterized protein
MPVYFFDTSAIVKHYHTEKGTPEVDKILSEQGSSFYISRLSTVEVQSVFAQKVRTQAIALQDLQKLQKLFAGDVASRLLQVVRMLQSHYREAERLLKKHAPTKSFRTLDAIQLAFALDLNRRGLLDHFVCADSRFCVVAQDEGLSVINPENT